MIVFYSDAIDRDKIMLKDQEARHCIQVLRKRKGDIVQVLDGKGSIYESEIQEVTKKEVLLRALNSKFQKESQKPVIAFGLIKSISRIEIMIEKLTEIGVTDMVPLICERSERKSLKPERCEKIIISAMKQSMRYYKPQLRAPLDYKTFISQARGDNKFIASYKEENEQLMHINLKSESAPVMLIGPEGDFTIDELTRALDAGFQPVNLGLNRLRTETAAIVACTMLQDYRG